jgi:hypothetical protein
MVRAAGTVAWDLLAFSKQIGIGCIGLSASWRQPWWCALLNVIEDPADELWIGDAVQSLRPGERCGERIGAFDGRLCRIELLVCRRGV